MSDLSFEFLSGKTCPVCGSCATSLIIEQDWDDFEELQESDRYQECRQCYYTWREEPPEDTINSVA